METRTVKEILIAARKRIEKPQNWLRHSYYNKNKTAFCAAGAIREEDGTIGPIQSPALTALRQVIGKDDLIGDFNDTHTHAEVLAAFDKAIAES
jgi:hypothetical protein